MDVVLKYQPGRIIPQVTLLIKWVGKEQPTEHKIVVKLEGVHQPESFVLQCIPNTSITGLCMLHITNVSNLLQKKLMVFLLIFVLSTWRRRRPLT